jgi:replicative DNA helicase
MDITEPDLRSEVAEKALIGALAFHPDALASVLASVPGNHFYSPHRENVWNICRALSAEGLPLDPVAVGRRLTEAGEWNPATQRVVQVEMASPSPAAHAEAHAATLADLYRRRMLVRALKAAHQVIADHTGDSSEILAAVRRQFDGLDEDETPDRKASTLTWSQLVDEFEQAHAGAADQGISSGWYQLDELIGGLHKGRMYTFGGRPGAGKSTAALNVAEHAAVESGKKVLIFSKEMPTVDVMGRILAWGGQVNVSSINHRRLSDYEKDSIRAYLRKVGQPSIRINASSVSLEGIKTIARAQHHRVGLDVLVVDYLQLVRSDSVGRSREQEVGKVSSELKALAMELGIVVILPAQLNRGPAARADARPMMSDLRDSGQIEQDSDAVILLWHQLTEKGEPTGNVTFIVDKNRHGPRGELELRWHGGYGGIGESR